jgi:hypothetical protein
MSIEALSSQVAGSYVALGVTDSGSTLGNLVSASKVSLLVRMGAAGSNLSWELWQGGATRTLLASGPVEDLSFNQLKLSYDPATQHADRQRQRRTRAAATRSRWAHRAMRRLKGWARWTTLSCAARAPARPKPRKFQHEAAAAAFARLAAHAAAMALGDLAHQRQAQADAAFALGMAGQAEEGLEDALAVGLGHAGAAVAHAHLDRPPRLATLAWMAFAAVARAFSSRLRRARRSSRSSPLHCGSPCTSAPTRAASSASRPSRSTRSRRSSAVVASSRPASSTSSTSASSSAMLVSISRRSAGAARRGVFQHLHGHLQPRQRRAQFVAGIGQQALVRRAPGLRCARRRG